MRLNILCFLFASLWIACWESLAFFSCSLWTVLEISVACLILSDVVGTRPLLQGVLGAWCGMPFPSDLHLLLEFSPLPVPVPLFCLLGIPYFELAYPLPCKGPAGKNCRLRSPHGLGCNWEPVTEGAAVVHGSSCAQGVHLLRWARARLGLRVHSILCSDRSWVMCFSGGMGL